MPAEGFNPRKRAEEAGIQDKAAGVLDRLQEALHPGLYGHFRLEGSLGLGPSYE